MCTLFSSGYIFNGGPKLVYANFAVVKMISLHNLLSSWITVALDGYILAQTRTQGYFCHIHKGFLVSPDRLKITSQRILSPFLAQVGYGNWLRELLFWFEKTWLSASLARQIRLDYLPWTRWTEFSVKTACQGVSFRTYSIVSLT